MISRCLQKLKPAAPIELRWMLAADADEVLAIERASFAVPWTAEDFTRTLQRRDVLSIVSHICGRVVGFAVYRARRGQIDLWNLAVWPGSRGKGVATTIIESLAATTPRLVAEVSERNVEAQVFLRNRGFHYCLTLPSHYEDQDAYVFERLNLPATPHEEDAACCGRKKESVSFP